MLSSPAQTPPQSNTFTIGQLIVSALGFLIALLAALAFFVFGLISLASGKENSSPVAFFSLAWIGGLVAILTLPSFLFSLQRLRGFPFPLPRIDGFRSASIALLTWPLVLVLGNWASSQAQISWLVLPPLLLVAIGLPVWWITEFARRNLRSGSVQRVWGIVNFSLLITTPLVVIVELVVLFLLLILFAVWLISQPVLLQDLQAFAQYIQSHNGDLTTIPPQITPFLQNPVIILGVFVTLAVIVPAIEEMLKPLALLPLFSHRLSPAEGFVAGMLCGGSFALIESLLSLAGQTQGDWAFIAIGRAGTGLLHITTTALTGWALARAWQNNNYLHLGLVYLGAAALHGLWNALSVLTGLNILIETVSGNTALAGFVGVVPLVLGIFGLCLFLLLRGMNQRLRQVKTAIVDPPQSS